MDDLWVTILLVLLALIVLLPLVFLLWVSSKMIRYENPPKHLQVNERLMNDAMFMHSYTTKSEQESAGFLIRAKHGGIGVVSQVLGDDNSVELVPNEQLHEGEEYLGTIHTHPDTTTFSIWDVATFLADKNEKISMNVGGDGMVNCLVKTDGTQEITKQDIHEFRQSYDEDNIEEAADAHKFLYYRGKGSKLELVGASSNGKASTLDDFVKDMKGTAQIPIPQLEHSREVNKSKASQMGLLDSRKFKRMFN
jgi:proteasome lid subunit RPN8/RPN11